MALYIISDTHFNHSKMVDYCNRPEDFDVRISKNLKSLSHNDTLFHLGDICIGRDSYIHEKRIEILKCKKILVRGNHDKRSNGWYLNHGWDFVCTSLSDNFFSKSVLLTHRPVDVGISHDVNIHGHLHNSGHHDGESMLIKNDKQILYSVEDYSYRPVAIEYLIDKWSKKMKRIQERNEE